MNLFNALAQLFWNKEQQRLRMVWRLGLHTGILFLMTALFTVGLLLLAVIFDLVSGSNLQNIISGSSPMQIQQSPWIGGVIVPLATFSAVILTTLAAGKWLDRRHIREFGIVFTKSWWIDFAFGLGLGALLMALIFVFGRLTGNVTVTGTFVSFTENTGFLGGFIRSLIFFIFVGVYEELLSRGYHLINLAEGFNTGMIGKRWALILAFIVSSAVFGLLHLGNPNASWISTLNISLAGVFLGLGMVLTGSLAIPIGLHITWNFFQGNVFGFPVSGVRSGATVFATELTGPAWLTGGPFGPEAGIMGLAAMLVGSLLTLWWLRRKRKLSLYVSLSEYQPKRTAEQTAETPKEA